MTMAMEQQGERGDARALVGQGDALLADGQVREAAATYAQAVQVDPSIVGGHLGLAEANLALGATGIVYMACRQVQMLAPDGADAALARAILFVLERRYVEAVKELDRVAELDPGRAYAHALRGYCLRQLGQTYDAQMAEGKARRLSSGKNFAPLFPPLQPIVNGVPMPPPTTPTAYDNQQGGQPPRSRDWSQASDLQRQALRLRFATRNIPLVTYTLIAINVLIYLLTALSLGGDFISPGDHITGQFTISQVGPLYYYGVELGAVMQHDPLQWYRLFTAMFLHASLIHIGANMFSLYFVGIVTERIFGRGRFTLIYFASGIIGGLVDYFFTSPNVASLGASGAIFGIFGAFGAFVILRRSLLGRAAGALIGQWLFFLVLNLYISVAVPGIALYDHLGGLISGFILGALLIPRLVRQT
jgi:membrane associated rhomboid family serine protease